MDLFFKTSSLPQDYDHIYDVNMGHKGVKPSRRPLNCARSILELLDAGKGLSIVLYGPGS